MTMRVCIQKLPAAPQHTQARPAASILLLLPDPAKATHVVLLLLVVLVILVIF
jgi:hypothetical protein